MAMSALGAGMMLYAAGHKAEALYANLDYMWSGSPVMIPVCFENPDSWNATARATVRQAIETTWQREARVNFTQWDTCMSGEPGLHIQFTTSGESSAPHGRELNGVNYGVKLNVYHDARTFIHEFGHALGFYHEEERPEYHPGSAMNPIDRNGNGIWDYQERKCDKQSYSNKNPYFFGAYDVNSVMSYCSTRTDPQLSPNDIAAARHSYGMRISGSLVSPHGYCFANYQFRGDSAFMWHCDEYLHNQEFDLDKGLLHHGTSPGLCLHATGKQDLVHNEYCSATNISRWDFNNVHVRGWGGTCLDLPGGNTSNGAVVLQSWACGALSGANQRWTINNLGEIRYGNTDKCLTAFAGNGNGVLLYDCNYPTYQRFEFLANGQIRLQSSPMYCLDVQGPWDSDYANRAEGHGLPGNGRQIQTFACTSAQTNQEWHFRGPITHRATGLCLDRQWGGDSPGTDVWLWDCNGGAAQEWDYYFK